MIFNFSFEKKVVGYGILEAGSLTLRKNYINGISTDNVIAYEVDESTNQGQISFCQNRVLAYQSEFILNGFSGTVDSCNNIQSSGTGIVTNRYYYHTNQLGSVIALTNSTGTVMQVYSYDAFGKAYVVNGSGTGTTMTDINTYTGSTYSNTRLYTGREYDKEIGMYYLRARYYNQNTGKFISRDPVGQNDQINLYTYVKNSPLMYTDRDGRKASQLLASVYNTYYDIASYPGNVAADIKDMHYLRNLNSKKIYYKQQDAINNGWILQSDSRSIYHTFGEGNEDNKKYLSPDGHEEVVFNKEGKIVIDPTNEGTYNYGNNDFKHAFEDIIPYYFFGNGSDDTTTFYQRVTKYFK